MFQSTKKNDLDFEINLLPIISILAVCICILLLTTVWIHVGSLNVSQGLGAQPNALSDKPALWIQMNNENELSLQLKFVQGATENIVIKSAVDRALDWQHLNLTLEKIRQLHPEVETALVMPDLTSVYNDIVRVMSAIKKNNIPNVGVTPL